MFELCCSLHICSNCAINLSGIILCEGYRERTAREGSRFRANSRTAEHDWTEAVFTPEGVAKLKGRG